ncbi:MAG: DUF2065 domain-containing protein [Pseudomonadota bacterium]
MTDLWTALALVLVVEGLLYAAFPGPMKRAVAMVLGMPSSTLRTVGLVSALIGIGAVWLIRG